eukprot:Rhum_TRINITY_DN12522_c0_g1::Rhum_TRINITY_DN12522_c0_g1_i1::g.52572::m.52572
MACTSGMLYCIDGGMGPVASTPFKAWKMLAFVGHPWSSHSTPSSTLSVCPDFASMITMSAKYSGDALSRQARIAVRASTAHSGVHPSECTSCPRTSADCAKISDTPSDSSTSATRRNASASAAAPSRPAGGDADAAAARSRPTTSFSAPFATRRPTPMRHGACCTARLKARAAGATMRGSRACSTRRSSASTPEAATKRVVNSQGCCASGSPGVAARARPHLRASSSTTASTMRHALSSTSGAVSLWPSTDTAVSASCGSTSQSGLPVKITSRVSSTSTRTSVEPSRSTICAALPTKPARSTA